ncbi:hypothetical protein [Butyrivibrio sp. YAB3001]|uniref:hypothetical protein n=1 Tax=Butyrivibrio sp. YAB3001 TaxID=1520812 RepID=UPI0008F61A13|nr:hypothetical protein [Butyrivibrio sp. YAB3001]SFC43651.1 hypothetical protein SAMN02910398_02269 [Butyrivibrio sp. YAB3001]
MKKRIVVLTTVFALTVGMIAGCGAAKEATSSETTQEETSAENVQETTAEASDSADAKEETVGIANPWVSITEEEAKEKCFRLFKAPDGATNQEWSMCEELGDPEKYLGPLVQLSFTLDDMSFTARAQQGAAEDADIAGNYVDWTVGPDEVTLANWGEGNMTGKTYRAVTDTGYVDMITWYDIEIGIAYSLSVAATDLDGFDIQAVAEQMYNPENEGFTDMPSDFLQEQAGKTSFDSYDDVIAALTPGQGYAYIKLYGSDAEYLAVTDLVFEADNTACEASIYGILDGKVTQLSLVSGAGSAYPLRLEDGILYAGSNHSYETYFISADFGGLMMKDYITDGVDTGTNEITGFTRQENTFDGETVDFTGGQEELNKLLAERENKKVIEFTMVK